MPEDDQAQPKYWAFISYSSKDRTWGEWLIAALEGYRVPKSLVGLKTRYGVIPQRLYPVFRDRDALRVGSDVGAELRKPLLGSRYLVVICSPNSADPGSWVGKEITSFKACGREDDVLALIVDGEPNASARPGGESLECFPAPLRHRFDKQGRETALPADPLAADIRREDQRPRAARRKALLKLIARMIDVDFDTLEQRDRRRQRQRRMIWSAAGMAVLAVLALLTGFWLSETRTALSQELSKQARDESDSQPDLALLLSVLSYRVAPTAGALDSILTTIGSRQNLVAFLHPPTKALAVAVAPDDRSVALASCVPTACAQSTITRYDLATLHALGVPLSVAGEVRELLYQAPLGRLLVHHTSSEGDELVAFDPGAPGTVPARRYRSSDPITSIQVSEGGQWYAVGMKSGEYKVFAEGAGRRCDGQVRGPVTAMAFSADGAKFAVLSEDDTTVIDLNDTSCAKRNEHTGERVSSVAFDPTASELYIVFLDSTVDRWRLGNGATRRDRFSFAPAEEHVHAFDPQARYLALQHTGHVRIYNLNARRLIEKAIAQSSDVDKFPLQDELAQVETVRLRDVNPQCIVFSPSGKLIATIDGDGQVIVWSTAEQPFVERSSSDQEPSSGTKEAVSPDGRFRAEVREQSEGCGTDAKHLCRHWTELRLVDAQSGLNITRLSGPRQQFQLSGPLSVMFKNDGSIAVQGEGWREVWQIAPKSLITRACHMANRALTDKEIEAYLGWRKRIVWELQPCGAE
ncbi:MAG: TIR domain-containing protein [Nitrospira sp.]